MIMSTRVPQSPARYSLLGLLDGGQYESGLAELAGKRYGAPQLRGQALPHGPLLRDLGVATATGGGNLGAMDLAAVAAAVRPLLVLEDVGARRLEVAGVAQLDLPKFDGGVGSWLGEGDAASSMSTTVESVAAVPHCAAARLAISRRVRHANRSDVEASVLAELEAAVRNTIEVGLLSGSGNSNQPLGILNATGVSSKAFAAATPTYSELIDMVELLGDSNGDVAGAAFLMHPSMAAALMKQQVSANGGETTITWSGGRHRIAGLPVAMTTNMPEAKVLLADFTTVQIIFFGGPQVIEDKYSGGKVISGTSEIVVMNHVDVVVRSPEFLVVGAS